MNKNTEVYSLDPEINERQEAIEWRDNYIEKLEAERDALRAENERLIKIEMAAITLVRRSIVDRVSDESKDGWHVELFTDKDAWESFFKTIPSQARAATEPQQKTQEAIPSLE